MPTRTPNLLDRIRDVVARHTQAKVARKTGVPPSSISRYLQGRKVPADFCARLAEAFGLNPSWLLLGEGAPDATEIADQTAHTAAGLLELVTAMERIARSKLGTLLDAEHGPLLLDLDRQLRRHSDLSAQLAERARPLLADLVERIDTNLRAGRIDEAERWLGAARQLEALVPGDDRLQLGLDRHAAYCAFRNGDRDESLRYQRRALRRQLFAPDNRHEALLHGTNLVITFGAVCRHEEAWRVGRALLALYEDGPREGEYAALQHQVGLVEVGIGRLADGTARMVAAAPQLPEDRRAIARTGLHEAWCWSGSVTLAELAASERARLADADAYTRGISAAQMARFALATEDVEPVADWMDELGALKTESARLTARRVIALAAPTRAALARFEEEPVDSSSPLAGFAHAVDACQLARCAGLGRLAGSRWKRADRLSKELRPEVGPALATRVVHARNTLLCAPKNAPERERAAAELRTLREAGYAIATDPPTARP